MIMAQQAPQADDLVQCNFKATVALLERIDREIAAAREAHPFQHVNRSAFIRHALGEYLDALDERQRVGAAP